jgi:hypothetical protein
MARREDKKGVTFNQESCALPGMSLNISKERYLGSAMHTTTPRRVGGSVMLAVPTAILDLLHLQAGATVGLAVDGERLVIDPNVKPHYIAR